jgi:hypothetical protein
LTMEEASHQTIISSGDQYVTLQSVQGHILSICGDSLSTLVVSVCGVYSCDFGFCIKNCCSMQLRTWRLRVQLLLLLLLLQALLQCTMDLVQP